MISGAVLNQVKHLNGLFSLEKLFSCTLLGNRELEGDNPLFRILIFRPDGEQLQRASPNLWDLCKVLESKFSAFCA